MWQPYPDINVKDWVKYIQCVMHDERIHLMHDENLTGIWHLRYFRYEWKSSFNDTCKTSQWLGVLASRSTCFFNKIYKV